MKPENRAGNRPPPPKEHQFKPGQSGNPGGRPKGLAAKVREATKDGQVLIQFWMDVVSGKVKGATAGDKLRASGLLAERGWGRAVESLDVEVSGKDGGPIEHKHMEVKEPERIGKILGHLASAGVVRLSDRKLPVNGENGNGGNILRP